MFKRLFKMFSPNLGLYNFLHIFLIFILFIGRVIAFTSKLLPEKNKSVLPKTCQGCQVLLWAITFSQIFHGSKTSYDKEEMWRIFEMLFNLVNI